MFPPEYFALFPYFELIFKRCIGCPLAVQRIFLGKTIS